MSRFNPHFPNADKVFEAAEQFKVRCLLNQKSLLLDETILWVADRFEVLRENYVNQPDVGEGNFYEKLAAQLASCEPLDVALMTEVFWIVQLGPINFRAHTKLATLKRIWNMNPAGSFPEHSPFLKSDVLSGLGSAGPGYNNYLWLEMAFAIEAFSTFVSLPLDDRRGLLAEGHAFSVWLESIPSGKGRQLYHTLCHVLFPDEFERIFSQGNKNQVARHHKIWTRQLGESRPALDVALLKLRRHLETQFHGQGVDYYEEPVGTLIRQEPAPAVTPAASSATRGASDSSHSGEPIADALPNKDDAIELTLRATDNLILYGPPGTGKTYAMQARMKAAYDAGEDFSFVSFHPSYSYEDFMGGLRPVSTTDGAGVKVEFHRGPFLRLCDKAHENPTQRFTLFIDEINRANVAKVFGELITLIEPTKRVIAGSKPNDNGAWVMLPGSNELFGVPDNVDIVATMNTADRSIAMLDIALRRRFRFQECPPDPDLISPAYVDAVHLPSLLKRLNMRLEYLLDRDHAIGHAFFIGVQTLEQLRHVIAERIIPLLQEYFFDDLEKVRLVLTGSTKDSAFFRTRSLKPTELFPGASTFVGSESRASLVVGDPNDWSGEDFIALYDTAFGRWDTGAESGQPQSAVTDERLAEADE